MREAQPAAGEGPRERAVRASEFQTDRIFTVLRGGVLVLPPPRIM